MPVPTTRWIWPGALVPAALATLCALAGLLVPDGESWGVYSSSALLTLARALPLLYVPWALVAAWRHRRFVLPTAVAVAGVLLAGVPGRTHGNLGGVRVVFANVLYKGGGGDPSGELARLRPDVLITLERDLVALPGLVRVAAHREAAGAPWKTMAVFCREGACEARVESHGTAECPMPVAIVRHASGICAIGLHAPPAGPPGCPESRDPYSRSVTSRIADGRLTRAWGPCEAGASVVVGGDLNAVPGQGIYRDLVGAGLRDPLLVSGVWARTFPDRDRALSVPLVRIDHALIGDLQTSGVRLISLPDSDHKAILTGVLPPESDRSASRR